MEKDGKLTEHYKRQLFVVFILFFPLSPFFLTPLFAANDLHVEGVMADDANPSETFAIVNGEPVKAGDFVGDYKIIEISQDSIRVKHSVTGEESVVMLSSGGAKQASPEQNKPGEGSPPLTAAPQAPESLQEKLSKLWKAFNPAALTNRAWETKAMLDGARIYNGAVQFFNKNGKLAKNLNELVSTGFLDKAYQDPKQGKYGFYLDPPTVGFGVHGDPLEKNSGLKYVFVGKDGVMREEEGKKATIKSTPHKF